MNFKKLNEDFPIFIWEKFYVLNDIERKKLMLIVLKNKKNNHSIGPGIGGGSFKITEDETHFFNKLYKKFLESAFDFFGILNISPKNSSMCWSYSSNCVDHGYGLIHNHMSTSTINSVYYLNVPDCATEESGSIQFFLGEKTFSYRPNNFDLIIFPNYLDHRINFLNDPEYRISINMEILCEEDSYQLFQR